MSCHYQDLGSTSDRSYGEKYFLQPITNIRWLVGKKHVPESKNTFQSPKHVPESKNSSQNPKHFPDSKNTSRIQNTSQRPKHFPESKTLRSENPKTLVIIQNTSQKPKTHSRILILPKNTFGFWEVFWIRGRFLDSGKCFGFWNVFLDSGRCFGFWEVFFYSGTSYGFWEVLCPYETR